MRQAGRDPELSADQLKKSIQNAPTFKIENIPPEACCLCATPARNRVTLLRDEGQDAEGYMVFPVCIACMERHALFVFQIEGDVEEA